MERKTLIIAFDGMDKELIEKFDLDNVIQQEYGTLDNKTGMSEITTSELFASFITGKTWREHGIKGLFRHDNPKLGEFIETLTPPKFVNNIRGFHRLRQILMAALNQKKRRFTKKSLREETIFEKINSSRAMFVPGYNPDKFWEMKCEVKPLQYGYSKEEYLNFWDERSFKHRKNKLFRELDFMSRPLLMCHFHRVDTYQHVYGDLGIDNYNEEKLRKIYYETDKLAAKIKDKAREAGYERIIFMSDHGLPAAKGHNKNAFYSSDKELFGEKKPRITDFASKLTD